MRWPREPKTIIHLMNYFADELQRAVEYGDEKYPLIRASNLIRRTCVIPHKVLIEDGVEHAFVTVNPKVGQICRVELRSAVRREIIASAWSPASTAISRLAALLASTMLS